MPLYAEIDANGAVLRVVVCDSEVWLTDTLGGSWVETSQTTVTHQGAGPGLYYSESIAPMAFIPPWRQPNGAHDAWVIGSWVWNNGIVWESLVENNVWEPGVSGWRDPLNEWPEWVQPTGDHDAYKIGDKVTFQTKRYVSTINANTWSPSAYPAGWELQP